MGNGGGVGPKCKILRVFIKEIMWHSDEGLRRGARMGELIGAERIKNRISQKILGGRLEIIWGQEEGKVKGRGGGV